MTNPLPQVQIDKDGVYIKIKNSISYVPWELVTLATNNETWSGKKLKTFPSDEEMRRKTAITLLGIKNNKEW